MTPSPEPDAPIPGIVLLYGLLGLIPFLAPPMLSLLYPSIKPLAATLEALYGGLILSFLGGARWGLAIPAARPSKLDVTLSMLPTLAALGLLALPAEFNRNRMFYMAIALGLQWVWDIDSDGLPSWYSRLRSMLTAGAVVGLASGALLLA
jgi:hypothetical protein